jgi:hypothetical protein
MSRSRENVAGARHCRRPGLVNVARKRAWLCSAAAAIFVSHPAAAQTYHGVAFAGASSLVALPQGQLGSGLAVRASVNAGRYQYDANGLEFDATYRGAEAALVYQESGRWGWANFSAGPRVSKLKLSPKDTANSRVGSPLDFGAQVDGALELKKWRLNWLGSVTLDDKAYLTQLAIGRMVEESRQTRLGAEAAVQGDGRYTKVSTGIFSSTRLGKSFEGRISLGVSDQKGRDLQPYIAAGTSLLF